MERWDWLVSRELHPADCRLRRPAEPDWARAHLSIDRSGSGGRDHRGVLPARTRLQTDGRQWAGHMGPKHASRLGVGTPRGDGLTGTGRSGMQALKGLAVGTEGLGETDREQADARLDPSQLGSSRCASE